MATLQRVNEEEFDERDERAYLESDERQYYQGKLFTGVGYLEHAKGQLSFEYTYTDGLPDGWCRQWYPNGQLKEEWFAVRARGTEGKHTTWHANGQVASIAEREHNVTVHEQAWDEHGKLVDEYKIDEASADFKWLQQAREQAKASKR